MSDIICYNCLINYSPQWRKIDKIIYCNSCGIHFKRNHFHKDPVVIYANVLLDIKRSTF